MVDHRSIGVALQLHQFCIVVFQHGKTGQDTGTHTLNLQHIFRQFIQVIAVNVHHDLIHGMSTDPLQIMILIGNNGNAIYKPHGSILELRVRDVHVHERDAHNLPRPVLL